MREHGRTTATCVGRAFVVWQQRARGVGVKVYNPFVDGNGEVLEELHEYLLQARFALENSQSEQWHDVLKNKTQTTGRKITYRCRESRCVELRKSRASSTSRRSR